MARRTAGGGQRGPWVAIAGTRPNFVKLAPLLRAARKRRRRLLWIDTGQHRRAALSRDLLDPGALGEARVRVRAPAPGRGRIPKLAGALRRHLQALEPSFVAVLGDVDSTLAGAMAAHALDLPLVHVEGGLRSNERGMPEERNRKLTDRLSDRLYLTETAALANLDAEGIARRRALVAGNVMADALLHARRAIERAAPDDAGYVMATFHRQAAVDDPKRLAVLVAALVRCAERAPVVFPVHPRTRQKLRASDALRTLATAGVTLMPPLPYVPFLGRLSRAAAVLTDSGGLQVEAALLGVRCVTLRTRTEHRITLDGGNEVVGSDPRRLPAALDRALAAGTPRIRRPRVWDGHAADRIVADWARGFPRPARLPGLPGRTVARL